MRISFGFDNSLHEFNETKKKMRVCNISVLFLIAISVFQTECASWSWMQNADGTLSIVDTSTSVEDSESTLAELKEDILFYLYTASNPEEAQQIYLEDDDTLAQSYFNASLPTRILIHGWQSSSQREIATGTRDAYLANGNYNVIAVDWNSYAKWGYLYARSKIITVAQYVALMIDDLEQNGMDLDDLIIAGHSLGGHIAGVAARSATNEVGAVVALDPAGPLFYLIATDARLSSADAKFVQCIHTSAGWLGYNGNLGHADIWVNGGTSQRGCGFDFIKTCAHSRSYKYLAESISNSATPLVASTCDSYSDYTSGSCDSENTTYLGGPEIDTSASGIYFLTTNKKSLFAQS